MESNEKIQWLLIFGVYGWMIFSDVLFVGQRELMLMNKIVSMVALISTLFITEAICQVAASKYFAIKAIIRPKEQVHYFFVIRSGITSKEHPKAPNFFTTELPLGVKIKIDRFGKIPISKIILKHDYDAEKRLIPSQGKVAFKGNVVSHNSMCTVVLYEYPEAGTDIDHARPIPTYYLANAPGDYYLGPIGQSLHNVGGNPNLGDGVRAYVQRLEGQILVLKSALAEKTRQSSYWHQFAIEVEGANKHIQEELSGLLKNPPNFMKGVVRYSQSLWMSIQDIRQLAKPSMFGFLKPWMMWVLVPAIVLLYLGLQPQIVEGIGEFMASGNNQLFIIIIVGFVVVGIYYFAKSRRGGGK